MKSWFTRDRRMGKNPRGPMEHQPNTWQGWLILVVHLVFVGVMLYFLIYTPHLLTRFLILILGGAVIFVSYNLIASFHAHDLVRGKKKGSEDHIDRFKKG